MRTPARFLFAVIAASACLAALAAQPAAEALLPLPNGDVFELAQDGRAQVSSAQGVVKEIRGLRTRVQGTATVVSDGSVLLLGGRTGDGAASPPQRFVPGEAAAQELEIEIAPRHSHTATLLTDGRLFIAGGVDEKGLSLRTTLLVDPVLKEVSPGPDLPTALAGHQATLQYDGSVKLSGLDSAGPWFYVPRSGVVETRSFSGESAATYGPLAVEEVLPPSGATGLDLDEPVGFRFSKPVAHETFTEETVTLLGPKGFHAANVVSAERGTLGFVKGKATLDPGSQYTVFLSGLKTNAGDALPLFVTTFETRRVTAAAAPGSSRRGGAIAGLDPAFFHPLGALQWSAPGSQVPGVWSPSQHNIDAADWRDQSGVPKSQMPALPALPKAGEGITALTGRVLRLNGQPLKLATLKIGSKSVETDKDGVFLLEGLTPGGNVLEIDGTTANGGEARFAKFFVRIVAKANQTTELGYTIWMPQIDHRGTFKISSPTDREVVLSTPALPGLELRIPAGTVIRERNGSVVTEINLTAVPIDKPPFPIPDIDVPIYFTIQPGGAWLESTGGTLKGAQLIYPNYKKAFPGVRSSFFNYDPQEREWYVYGEGQVSADGASIVPDATTRLYEFTGAMVNGSPAPPPPGPKPCNSPCCEKGGGGPPDGGGDGGGSGGGGWGKSADGGDAPCDSGGDPVSLSKGYFLHTERDLYVQDVIPIDVTRTYRSQDNAQRTFGIGWNTPYDINLYSASYFTEMDVILPDGGRVHFVRTSSGTGYFDAVFESTEPGRWHKARIHHHATKTAWELFFKDGTSWLFPRYQPISEITDPNGNRITITRRDSGGVAGPITRIQSPNGRYIDFTLDGSGRVTQAKDNVGRTFGYTYDTSGRLTKVTDPMSGERNYTYDTNHRLLTVKDPLSVVAITNEYDINGRVQKQTLADTSTFLYAFTLSSGNVTVASVTDQRGKVRRVEFDSSGRITKSTAAYGTSSAQETNFTLDSNGQITEIIDPLGRRTVFVYDAWGNKSSITRLYGTADAVAETYGYSADGSRLTSYTNPLNKTTTMTYDARGNLLTIADPMSHTVTYARDQSGRITSVTDALGHTWQSVYSGPDLVSTTDPLSRTTQVSKDAVGRTTTVVDAMGHVATAEYDSLNRVLKRVNPLAGQTQLGYDANGNVTSLTDPRNNTTTYTYNNLSLPSGKTDPVSNSESYAYGPNGQITQVTDRKSQVTGITYDDLNRLSQVGFGATVSNPTSFTSTVGYTFDAVNRITQIADSVGGTITRTYDGLNRLTQEQTPQGTISYTYDAANRRATMTVLGQSAVSYIWDDAGRLTQMAQGTDSITFTYDNANRRTKTTLANGVEIAYAFDNANQLSSITYSKGGTTIGDLVYTYDAKGRRIKVSGSLAKVDLPAPISSAVYNAANRLTTWAGSTFSYDLNGNLTGDGTNTYSWDSRNQLSSISGGVSATFGYDALGRRKSKTIGASQTGFVYDGLNFVQELTGSTVIANLLTGGIDQVFQRKETSTTRHPITDAIGGVIALTDASGALATEYTFEPYGKATVAGSADTNSQTFTAREDDGTGLFYYRARYYMPGCGRFISEDPLGLRPGPNVYAYVNGNPVSGFDPLGLDDWWRTPSWSSPDGAAEAALCRIYDRSASAGVEYGGWVTRNSDGSFGFSPPVTDNKKYEVNIGYKPPNGAGSYHTHPPDEPGSGGASFPSPGDSSNTSYFGVPTYIGIPNRRVKRLDLNGDYTTVGYCSQ